MLRGRRRWPPVANINFALARAYRVVGTTLLDPIAIVAPQENIFSISGLHHHHHRRLHTTSELPDGNKPGFVCSLHAHAQDATITTCLAFPWWLLATQRHWNNFVTNRVPTVKFQQNKNGPAAHPLQLLFGGLFRQQQPGRVARDVVRAY